MTDSYHFNPAQPTVCFDDVKARTIALAKISRCAAVDALAVFSVARARELMPWEWASYVEYVDGLLAIAASSTVGPFPSGATLKTSGDKIVGRVEAKVVVTSGGGYSSKIPCCLTVTVMGAGGGSAPEPKRAPLDWNTATPFDTFGADFIVTKGEVPTAPLHTSPTTDSAYPAIAGLLRG